MDPKHFPERYYPDGTVWRPDDECEERAIIKNLCPDYEESFRAVTGSGERRVVVVKEGEGYSVQIQYWDANTKGHIIEDIAFDTELAALERAHELLDLEFERWRFGFVEGRD
jgi:hypothetical protein